MKNILKSGFTVAAACLTFIAGAETAFAGNIGNDFRAIPDSTYVKINRDSIYNTDFSNSHEVVMPYGASTFIAGNTVTIKVQGYNPGGTPTCTFEIMDLQTHTIYYTSNTGSTSLTGFYTFTVTGAYNQSSHPGASYLRCVLPPATAGQYHYLQAAY